jgi:hypothetical protein
VAREDGLRERDSDGRRRAMQMSRKRWIAGAVLAVAAVGGGTGFAIASSGDDDQPLTGSVLDQATAAALAHTGGGTVLETEAGDDGAAYGVEVRLDDGSVVEVSLDETFHVLGDATDDDGADVTGDDDTGDED